MSSPTRSCRFGLDDLHRQLYEGKNHLLTRVWLKHLLFHCHYSGFGCGYHMEVDVTEEIRRMANQPPWRRHGQS